MKRSRKEKVQIKEEVREDDKVRKVQKLEVGSEYSLLIMCNAHVYVEIDYRFLSSYLVLLSFIIHMATISGIT